MAAAAVKTLAYYPIHASCKIDWLVIDATVLVCGFIRNMIDVCRLGKTAVSVRYSLFNYIIIYNQNRTRSTFKKKYKYTHKKIIRKIHKKIT